MYLSVMSSAWMSFLGVLTFLDGVSSFTFSESFLFSPVR